MMARLHGLFRGAFAPESWVLSQSYYYGGVGDGARAEVIDGTPIDLADELDEIAIGKSNGSSQANGGTHRSSEPEAPIEDIVAALEMIPNPDLPWDGEGGWNYVGMATWRASGGSEEGLTAFVDWSCKSRKFDAAETEFRWRHYADSPPNELSFGTLVFLARKADPNWTPPSRRLRPDVATIKISGGHRPEAVAAGMDALVAAGAEIYRRDKQLVYVVRLPAKASDGRQILIPGVARVETPHLLHLIGKAANCIRFDGRRKDWVTIDVPTEIATTIAAIPNEWRFAAIAGIVGTPTLRPDDTLLTVPGYDPATGYVLFEPPPMPSIPPMPTRQDAEAALRHCGVCWQNFRLTTMPAGLSRSRLS